MRHGPAEDRARTGRDFDRRLTPAGREVVLRVAYAFQAARAAGAAPSTPLRILTSPRARAHETAMIVRAAILPIPHDIAVHDELGGDLAIPRSLIAEASASGVDTLLVGHQPRVEELVQALVGAPVALAGFPTATIVGLDWITEDGAGKLAARLDPAQLPR